MVDGLLADIGIGVVLPIRSSLLARSRPVPTCHWDSTCGTWIRRVKNSLIRSVMNRTQDVDCQKRFPVFQTSSMYQMACFGRGST